MCRVDLGLIPTSLAIFLLIIVFLLFYSALTRRASTAHGGRSHLLRPVVLLHRCSSPSLLLQHMTYHAHLVLLLPRVDISLESRISRVHDIPFF